MDIKQVKIFDATEPLSKALEEILESGTAAFVVKNGALFGLIDDRNIRMGILDLSKTKCENASVRCPSIKQDASVQECIDCFLAGHFKALPVLDPKGRIIGSLSRSDLLKELSVKKLIPKMHAYQLMSTPVYTIDLNKTVADAKSEMKRTGLHRLVVTRMGKIVGTISTLDFVGLLSRPKQRGSYELISEVKNFDSKKIGDVIRSTFVTVPETATLEETALKMATKHVSSVIVIKDNKPVGVLSATDIFKLVRKQFETETDVMVSGLDADSLVYYGKIKEIVLAYVSKFKKSFKIENIAVHIKKGKSVYEANIHLDINNRHVAFKCEGHNMEEVIAAISKELKTIFEKAKSEKIKTKKITREENE